jgi:DNA-binding transcriptional LysR family regulator
MELRHLEYVVAIADTQSFTRAAERSFVVQSALSQQVRRLEEELGTRLFERTSRSVRLTAAGEAFLPIARRILADAERAKAEVAAITGLLDGRIAIGSIGSVPKIDLPRLLGDFHARHPGVAVSLREDVTERILAGIRSGDLDAGFICLSAGDEPDGVDWLEVTEQDLVAVVARDHPLTGTVGLDRLAEEVVIDFVPGSGLRALTDRTFRGAGLAPQRGGFEVASVAGMAGLVALGLGVALVPRSIAEQLDAAVRWLPVQDAPRRTVFAVWGRHPSPATRAFAGLVKERLAAS